ncbi:MAG: hypothetical protein AB4426_12455 [Xenococcaceae cyanobacterium]
MNKFKQIKATTLATVGSLSVGAVCLLTPSAMAQKYSDCFMINESGQVVELSSICEDSPVRVRQGLTEPTRPTPTSSTSTNSRHLSESSISVTGFLTPAKSSTRFHHSDYGFHPVHHSDYGVRRFSDSDQGLRRFSDSDQGVRRFSHSRRGARVLSRSSCGFCQLSHSDYGFRRFSHSRRGFRRFSHSRYW